jgi:predicted nucleic acid-binding protein
MIPVHLDADFLIRVAMVHGPERERLLGLAETDADIRMSAIAWYEFLRGPRTPEELAMAGLLLDDEDIVPWTVELAGRAADTYRRGRISRRRANDIAIGTTAAAERALLLTVNPSDFKGIPGLSVEAPRR